MITDTKSYKDLSSVWTEVWRETRDHFDNESDAFKKLFSAVGEFLDNIEDGCEYEDDYEQDQILERQELEDFCHDQDDNLHWVVEEDF